MFVTNFCFWLCTLILSLCSIDGKVEFVRMSSITEEDVPDVYSEQAEGVDIPARSHIERQVSHSPSKREFLPRLLRGLSHHDSSKSMSPSMRLNRHSMREDIKPVHSE